MSECTCTIFGSQTTQQLEKNTILPLIFIQEKLYYHCTVQNGTEVFSCLPKADSANMMIPGVQIVQLKAKHEYQILDRAGLI